MTTIAQKILRRPNLTPQSEDEQNKSKFSMNELDSSVIRTTYELINQIQMYVKNLGGDNKMKQYQLRSPKKREKNEKSNEELLKIKPMEFSVSTVNDEGPQIILPITNPVQLPTKPMFSSNMGQSSQIEQTKYSKKEDQKQRRLNNGHLTDEQFYQTELKQGRKAYVDFLEDKGNMVRIYDDVSYSEWNHYLRKERSFEARNEEKVEGYKKLLKQSQCNGLTLKLHRILWEKQREKEEKENKTHSKFHETGAISSLSKNTKFDNLKPSSSSMKKVREALELQAKIKEKANQLINNKFKHTGLVVQTLSRSFKLKPVLGSKKRVQTEEDIQEQYFDQSNTFTNRRYKGGKLGDDDYQFNVLIKNQGQQLRKIRDQISPANKGYLIYDFQEIQRYLKSLN